MQFFKSISSKIKGAEEKFIESKILIMILPVILILILILFSAPLILNNQTLREDLESKFSNQLKAELKINGEIKTSLFPVPNITFNEVYLRNLFTGSKTIHLHSEKITIKLSILSAFLSKFDITSISINNATMEVASSDNAEKTKSKELIKLISESQLKTIRQGGIGGNLFPVDELNLNNSHFLKKINFSLKDFNLIYYSKLGNKKQIDKVNMTTNFKQDSLLAKGDFINKGIFTNFLINFNSAKTNKDSSILLKSEIMELLASGKFSSTDSKDFFENFKGNLSAKIFNLKGFYKSFISDNNYIFKKLKETSDPIKLSSSITKEGLDIFVQDCEIQSQDISGATNIYISYLEKLPIVDIELNLGFVNFDKIFIDSSQRIIKKDKKTAQNSIKIAKKQEPKLLKDEKNIAKELVKDLRDVDLNLELSIEKARYLFEEIHEISLYSSISKNGEVLILPLSFKTPGNGKFRITGIFENRNDTPKFLGKLDATGENLSMLLTWFGFKLDNLKYSNLSSYAVYSDVFQKPGSTHFDNLYINIKDGPEILGESNIYHQEGFPYTVSKLDISNLEISRFFQTSSKNTYLSPGSLLKKLLWVNSLNSRNDLEISIDNLIYNNKTYYTNEFKTRIGKNYIEIDNMKIESEDSDIATSLAIEIKESISKFNLSLKSEKLKIMPEEKTDDIKFKKDEEKVEDFSLVDTLFSLPSFEGFSGNIIIDLKDTKINSTNLSNSKINAKMNDGIIKFETFRSGYKDGRVNFTGSAALKFDKSLSGNLTLIKFPIKDILSLYNIENIDGTANISSSIASFGSNKNEFIAGMSLKAKYNASAITVKNYGLDSMIRKLFNFAKYADEIYDPKDMLYSKIETTKIKNSSGTISINRKTEDSISGKFSGTAFNGTINSKFSNQSLSGQGEMKIIFLTGSKKRQIPITIASNFKGELANLEFSDNFSQAETYIERGKKFYSNPQNKNRDLVKVKKQDKKEKPIEKSQLINQNNNSAAMTQQQLIQIMQSGGLANQIPAQPPTQ